MKFRILIEPDEDGVFIAECPTLPGCISQGATREEAISQIKDAIAGYLASLKKHAEVGTLRSLIREAGISKDHFAQLLDLI